MAVAGITPTASLLTKIGMTQIAGCRLCRIVQEARGKSTNGLSAETDGHINNADREGMARQLRLPIILSIGTCMSARMLHKSKNASSSLSHLTKIVT